MPRLLGATPCRGCCSCSRRWRAAGERCSSTSSSATPTPSCSRSYSWGSPSQATHGPLSRSPSIPPTSPGRWKRTGAPLGARPRSRPPPASSRRRSTRGARLGWPRSTRRNSPRERRERVTRRPEPTSPTRWEKTLPCSGRLRPPRQSPLTPLALRRWTWSSPRSTTRLTPRGVERSPGMSTPSG